MMLTVNKTRKGLHNRFEPMDAILLIILVILAAMIAIPFISVIATSFATQKEAAESPLMLIPMKPTIDNYWL